MGSTSFEARNLPPGPAGRGPVNRAFSAKSTQFVCGRPSPTRDGVSAGLVRCERTRAPHLCTRCTRARTAPVAPREPAAPGAPASIYTARMFVNKVAIVTGASSGIGRAAAVSFAAAGASVVAVGRDRAALEAVVGDAGQAG